MKAMRMIAVAGMTWCMAVALAAGAQGGGKEGKGSSRMSRPGRVGVNGKGTYAPGQQSGKTVQQRSRPGKGEKAGAPGVRRKGGGNEADIALEKGVGNVQEIGPDNPGVNRGVAGMGPGNRGGGGGGGPALGGGKKGGKGHGGPLGKNGFGGPKGKNGFGGAKGMKGARGQGGNRGGQGGKGGNRGGKGPGKQGQGAGDGQGGAGNRVALPVDN